ncbi:hypothetical protein ACHAXT_002884 [Thalassiosira profunda]
MTLSPSSVSVLLLAALLSGACAFVQPQFRVVSIGGAAGPQTSHLMSPDDDTPDTDEIDPNSLGDWRAFRMNLSNTGLSSSSATSVDGIDLEDTPAVASVATSTSQSAARPKSVSKKNEELLNAQNAALAEEYLNGVWAHEAAVPEVGGLVCRLPLEAEIYRNPHSAIHQKLQSLLDSDDYDRTESPIPDSLSSAASTGGAASADVSAQGTISRSSEDSACEDDDASPLTPSFAKTVFWYRGAEKLLKEELLKITSNANTNGRIEANDLDDASLELLQMYMQHQATWQEVCLVIEKDEKTGCSKTVTINRPMAFKLSESMGRLVLMGAYQAEKGGGAVNKQESNGVETQNVVKFLGAFENQCGVYVGGPDDMDQPAVMVHGIDDLPGAVEVSPGTGIYTGGLEAAMDGVLAGKYKPLDFRFFIGHTKYEGAKLDEAVRLGQYQPVACSRPLVLKQCIQLPKPLWHEVLEFCGGELKEISKLELAKRDDLQ